MSRHRWKRVALVVDAGAVSGDVASSTGVEVDVVAAEGSRVVAGSVVETTPSVPELQAARNSVAATRAR